MYGSVQAIHTYIESTDSMIMCIALHLSGGGISTKGPQ